MDQVFINKIRGDLIVLKDKIISRNNFTESAEIDSSGDEIDEIQAKQIVSVAARISMQDRVKINKIGVALKKITEGTFGICEECNENISEKRLNANPIVENCISCAELLELEEKRKR